MQNILLLLDTSKTSVHRFLAGIAKYSRLHGPWAFNHQPPFYMIGGRKRNPDQFLSEINPDGIIMHDTESNIAKHANQLSIPIVLVRNINKPIPDVPDVVGETTRTGIMAAEHLIARGFKYFAFCGYSGGHYWTTDRQKSFSQYLESNGKNVHIYLPPKARHKSDEKKLIQWLISLPKPIGIMACNDDRSQEIAEACKIAELNVPEEVAIIGVDNDTLICELSTPPLSSIAVNSEKAGYDASELLDKMMSGQKLDSNTITVQPTHIVTRQSTDVLAITDKAVAKAINYIHKHSNEMIQVDDVVGATLLSKRVLQQRFKQTIGRSIKDEIRITRVEQIIRMLLETNMSVSEIAQAMEFPDVHHIARYFRKEKGMSPLQYKKTKT